MFKKILILITGLLIGIGIFFFREAGNLLSWSEILQPADAILVVGGGGPERIAKSIELYHADMASLLIISG
ncbi:MAG: hypothetical protein U9Q15_02200 [Patescibacteria group bacterium]|nr:hypothetical protein [Patescibacteria group bacterium]